MTREEAKEMIKHILNVTPKEPPTECDNVEEWRYEDDEIRKALDMAMKALEQEPCEDAVSRKAVDLLCFEFLRANSDDNCAFYERFRDLPPVTPTRKASEWQQDHAIIKAHSDGANEVIDRIKEAREEIKDMQSHIQLKDKTTNEHWIFVDKFEVLAILDKLIAEVEGKDATERKRNRTKRTIRDGRTSRRFKERSI